MMRISSFGTQRQSRLYLTKQDGCAHATIDQTRYLRHRIIAGEDQLISSLAERLTAAT